jgi:hypothetical protein
VDHESRVQTAVARVSTESVSRIDTVTFWKLRREGVNPLLRTAIPDKSFKAKCKRLYYAGLGGDRPGTDSWSPGCWKQAGKALGLVFCTGGG